MSKLAFWNRGNLAIVTKTQDGFLNVAPATQSHDPDLVFTPQQPKSLFATLKDSGLPVRSACLSLYGKKGKVEPEHTRESAKDGKEYPYAYSAKQIAEFDAKGVIVKEYFNGKAYAPLVMAFASPPATQAKTAAPFKRVNIAEEISGNIKPDARERAAAKPSTRRVNVDESED